MKTLGAVFAFFLLAGCASPAAAPAAAPAATLAPLPTYTPAPPVVATQLVTVEVTRIVAPTGAPTEAATAMPAASDTPSMTDTPAATDTAVPTANAATGTAAALGPLTASRPDGNYLVNVDIAPGEWRNDGTASDGTNCYWQTLDKAGNTLKNYLGSGKGTMFVPATVYQVHMDTCGTWTYLSP